MLSGSLPTWPEHAPAPAPPRAAPCGRECPPGAHPSLPPGRSARPGLLARPVSPRPPPLRPLPSSWPLPAPLHLLRRQGHAHLPSTTPRLFCANKEAIKGIRRDLTSVQGLLRVRGSGNGRETSECYTFSYGKNYTYTRIYDGHMFKQEHMYILYCAHS